MITKLSDSGPQAYMVRLSLSFKIFTKMSIITQDLSHLPRIFTSGHVTTNKRIKKKKKYSCTRSIRKFWATESKLE